MKVGRNVKKGLRIVAALVVLGLVFFLGTTADGVGASSDPGWVHVDQILGISVDVDADGSTDYQIAVSGVDKTFRTEEGFVLIELVGEVTVLRPLP
jgi:hypothetical protein